MYATCPNCERESASCDWEGTGRTWCLSRLGTAQVVGRPRVERARTFAPTSAPRSCVLCSAAADQAAARAQSSPERQTVKRYGSVLGSARSSQTGLPRRRLHSSSKVGQALAGNYAIGYIMLYLFEVHVVIGCPLGREGCKTWNSTGWFLALKPF